MCNVPDVSAEEILRDMIRDRIGSEDAREIKLAGELREFLDTLCALGDAIEALEDGIRQAGDPGSPEPPLPPEQESLLRRLIADVADLKAAMEALITTSWKEGYRDGFADGWEDSAGEREQVLATVTDLTSRLRG